MCHKFYVSLMSLRFMVGLAPVRFGSSSLLAAVAAVLSLAAAPLHAQTEVPAVQVLAPAGAQNAQALRWSAPAPARLQFAVAGRVKNFPYKTSAQIDWLPLEGRYEASQALQIPIVGVRRQSSTGTIGPQGLRPEIFMDQGRKEYSTTFDASAGHIRFSRGSTPAPLVAGTQDRLSVFFQVAGMVAAAPSRYPAGTQLVIQAASSSHVTPWTFTVRGSETLQLPAGAMQALKLEHSSDSAQRDGLQSALWLAPQLQYLPVRIRLMEDEGRDELDLKLKSHSKP